MEWCIHQSFFVSSSSVIATSTPFHHSFRISYNRKDEESQTSSPCFPPRLTSFYLTGAKQRVRGSSIRRACQQNGSRDTISLPANINSLVTDTKNIIIFFVILKYTLIRAIG